MHRRNKLAVVVGVTLATCASVTSAAPLYSDNFNTNTSANWTINAAPTANAGTQSAEFAFDYSTSGIPAAPGSTDTLGLRLRANIPADTNRPAGVTSGLSVSPTGKNFGTNYRVTFYAWSNFNGAANASGIGDNANSEGGTNNVMFALGTSGTVPLVVGNTGLVTNGQMDGIGFATTGDGGITNDYRVYPKSGTIVPGTNTAVYAAGSNANTATYYTSKYPSVAAPTVQQQLSTDEYGSDASNTQAGQTQAGAFGFAWHKVVLTKDNGVVTWDIDDSRMATFDLAGNSVSLTSANLALGVSDVNTSTTRHPSLLFTVFDNLQVESVPEPSGIGLIVAGSGLLLARRRRIQA